LQNGSSISPADDIADYFHDSGIFLGFHVHLSDPISISKIAGPSSQQWTEVLGGPPEAMQFAFFRNMSGFACGPGLMIDLSIASGRRFPVLAGRANRCWTGWLDRGCLSLMLETMVLQPMRASRHRRTCIRRMAI
jgi:hypothetical protein